LKPASSCITSSAVLLIFLVKRLPGAQFGFDFLVGRERGAVVCAHAAGGLAFRGTVIADAFFRHQASRGAGYGAPQMAGG
jgi:hypothetical protein